MAICRYSKGGVSMQELQEMHLPEYIILRNAITELVRQEIEETEKAADKWKR